MKKTRIKTNTRAITREEAENLVHEIAVAENLRRIIKATLDEKTLAIREKYAPDIAAADVEIKANSALVQAWAEANPDDFGKKKSIVFRSGTVGFRTGTPKAKTRAGFTWARVLEKLKSVAWGFAFVRVSEEAAKDELIAAATQSRITNDELQQIGVEVVQDESFFIEPDLTAVQERITATA
jgi:phage host-nuclease inhibitor protein Gam